MCPKYYMHRENLRKIQLEIGSELWSSYKRYIIRIAENNYLAENFSVYDDQDLKRGFDRNKFNSRMLEELGTNTNFFEFNNIPSTIEILSIIEFVYIFISKPIELYEDNYNNESYVTKFDSKKGRYEYTIYVNELFQKYRHPYTMKNGKISRIYSKVLDKRVDDTFLGDDEYLNKLLMNAIALFRDPSNKKVESLASMANILERLKTYRGSNKKKSIKEIICKITDDSKLQELLNNHLDSMTKISNNCAIRHQEMNKIIVQDDKILEFLFYSYYNIIRLIIDTHNIKLNL